jgi:hypothetical protein
MNICEASFSAPYSLFITLSINTLLIALAAILSENRPHVKNIAQKTKPGSALAHTRLFKSFPTLSPRRWLELYAEKNPEGMMYFEFA